MAVAGERHHRHPHPQRLAGGGGSVDVDFDGAVGFNIGAGIGTESGLYGEFIFHIVTQEFKDDPTGTSFGVNNFGAHIGYSFSIN